MSDIKVIPFKYEYIDEMRILIKDFIKYLNRIEDENPDADQIAEKAISDICNPEYPGHVLLAVNEKKQLIGLTSFNYEYWLECGDKSAHIMALSVKKESRGSGVGNLLLDAVEKEAKKQDCSYIRLTVHHRNDAAIDFYRKRGGRFDTSEIILSWKA